MNQNKKIILNYEAYCGKHYKQVCILDNIKSFGEKKINY